MAKKISKAAKAKKKATGKKVHPLSLGPFNRELKRWLERARKPRKGDPDVSHVFKILSSIDVPPCPTKTGKVDEVPPPPK